MTRNRQIMAVVLCLLAGAATAHAADGGAITGKVTIAGKKKRKVPPMVVYLEAADPKKRFDPPAKEIVVTQNGAKFSPSMLVVARGQAVQFRNDEDRDIEHNVFSRSPSKSFDLGLYPPGEQKGVTFDRPGEIRLFCSIHRYMDGVIYVCPTPFFSQVQKDGSYKIPNVPPGEYKLKTWQRKRRYRDQSRPLTVTKGKTSEVNLEMKRK